MQPLIPIFPGEAPGNFPLRRKKSQNPAPGSAGDRVFTARERAAGASYMYPFFSYWRGARTIWLRSMPKCFSLYSSMASMMQSYTPS